MTSQEAAKLLELPVDATPEQLEARFLELRRKLEDKVAKAPTPGLQAKYRETLTQITTAFETLTLAADSSSLPVLHKAGDESPAAPAAKATPSPAAPGPAPAPRSETPKPAAKKSGSHEFLFVALLALVLLGAGGWWVMHLRAEKAEQARLAAIAAEEKIQAEIAAKAEADRLAAQGTVVRTQLAEARVEWEAIESDLRDVERKVSDLKSELRGARDLAPDKKAELSAQTTTQEMYATWLKNFIVRNPVKVARARTEELLQAKEVDAATESCNEMLASLASVTESINQTQHYFFNMTGALGLESRPSGVAWILTDPYGRVTEGKTTATLNDLPLTHLTTTGDPTRAGPDDFKQRGEFTTGKYVVRFVRTGWPEVVREATLVADNDVTLSATFAEGTLAVESLPAGIPFTATNSLGWKASGTTPATVPAAPPGKVTVRLSRTGYKDVTQDVTVTAEKTAKASLDQRPQTVNITVAEKKSKIFVDSKFAGYEKATLSDLSPGEHALQIESGGYTPYRTKFTIKQENTQYTLKYSFADLARRDIACSSCGGRGNHDRQERCNTCRGSGWVRCTYCNGNGSVPFLQGTIGCMACSSRGQVPCSDCGQTGVLQYTDTCSTCNGQGYFSKLERQ